MIPVQSKNREAKLLKKITDKIKHGLVLDSIRNQIARIGVNISPYYWVQEGMNPTEVPEINGIISDYTVGFIEPEEIKKINEDLGTYSVEGLLAYYNAGKKCLGLKYKDELASFMFINLTECDFTARIIPLKNDEAYLAYMYTMKAFRGKNLAPYLRYRSYEILKKMGRDKIYSVSMFFNSPDMIQALAGKMQNQGIVPELEAFDAGMINYAKFLIKRGLLKPPYYFNLLLGNIACAQADILHAGIMIRDLPENSIWSLAGIGDEQLKMNSVSIAIGGGVRVGLEDNIWYDTERTILARNIDLIKRIHILAEANCRKIMTPEEFRQKMNLEAGHGKYGRIDN